MKAFPFAGATLATSLCAAQAMAGTLPLLHPQEWQWTSLSGQAIAYNLSDESGLAGDPRASSGGAPTTQFSSGFVNQVLYYPLEAVLDLGARTALSDLYYYDVNGADSIQVSYRASNGNWVSLFNETTTGWNSWKAHAVACTTSYIRVRLKSPQSQITELLFYGQALETPRQPPTPTPRAAMPMGKLMGINGFVDDELELLSAVGAVREYHSWVWDDGNGTTTAAYPNNLFGWNPSWVRWTGGGWNFDEYYQSLQDAGLDALPVFQGTAGWMVGNNFDSTDRKPVWPIGADASLPASYKAHADYMYQFAARFGSTTVATNQLRVDALNTPKSGLGTVGWMENWNEPDKTWKARVGYFTPVELAAMSSADYDGHQGALGANIGLKQASPSMKMALPGLAGLNLEYLRAMKVWSDWYRNGSFPADALNLHHYCSNSGGQTGSTFGISPESDDLVGRLRTVVQWRNQWLPGVELWLSEFGWDTNPSSPLGAPAIGSTTSYETQGRWLVRAYLAIAAAGVDRAQMFLLRDDWDSSPGIFATSGLVHDKHDTLSPRYEKKPSWYYVNTLHKTLRNFQFDAEVSVSGASATDSVRVYRFRHATVTDSVAYAAWLGTSSDKQKTIALSLPADSLLVVRLVDGAALGNRTTVRPSAAASFQIPLSESPAILVGKSTDPVVAKVKSANYPSNFVPSSTRRFLLNGKIIGDPIE